MNKKDFWTLTLFNIVGALLFVEHLCSISLALELFIGWTILSSIVHLFVLRDYVRIHIEEV